MTIAGLDIGTTGCKITVFRETGESIFSAYCEYEAVRSRGKQEISAEQIWDSVKKVMKEAAGTVCDIGAVGISSFGESIVVLDENDRSVLPMMLYTDPRGQEECAQLTDRIGKDRIAQITGVNPHPMFSIPKTMWIKAHRPEIYGRIRHIFLVQDFVVYMLTGVSQIDYSLATRTMAFDIKNLCWSEEIFRTAGISSSLFSKPVRSGASAGKIKEDIQKEFAFPEHTVIVSGCHDQVAAAIGAGVLEDGMAIDGTGTVECITPVFDSLPEGSQLLAGNFAAVPHGIPNKYVCYAFSFTGGLLLKWYRDNFAKYEEAVAKKDGKNVYAVLDGLVGAKPTGILVLPHFAGAATPYMDEGSQGAIVGLTLEHTAADIYRALMEGVTYEMLLNIELLEKSGIKIKELRATGGGASSRVWLQMKADILNRPIVSLCSCEAGAAGSAMLAGVAAGLFHDLEEASLSFVKFGKKYYPDPEQHCAYMEIYDRYRRLYSAVRPLVSQN